MQRLGVIKKLVLILVVLVAVILRIYFAPRYFHVDILSNAGWGEWIANNGAKGFFDNGVWTYSWPTQLPLVNLIYGWCYQLYVIINTLIILLGSFVAEHHLGAGHMPWLYQFVEWWGNTKYADTSFKIGFLVTIKLVAILADLAIGLVIWFFVRAKKIKNGWLWPLIYLWSPFSIYLSSFWGQYDQLAFLFLLLSILSIKKYPILSPILISISLGIKPTGAMFVPFYLYLLIRNISGWKSYVAGIIVAAGLNLGLLQLFNSGGSLIDFVREKLLPVVLYKSEFRISVNSYNFWHMVAGDKAVSVDEGWPISYKYLGLVAIVLLNWLAIRIDIKNKKNTFMAIAVLGIGSWMFGVNMLERYLFGGIVFGLMATMFDNKLLKVWLMMSLMFVINLHKCWWQPEFFGWLRYVAETWPMWGRWGYPLINLGLLGKWLGYLPSRRSRC